MEYRCSKCKEIKLESEFYKNKTMPNGIHYWCKVCHLKWQKDKYDTNSLFRQNKRKHWREWNLKKNYGLTPQSYDLILRKQRGLCAICQTPAVEFNQRLCVDHNHKTGQIRGLLCDNCNKNLGVIENHEFRLKAEDYLSIYW
jgi:hypothetical protein